VRPKGDEDMALSNALLEALVEFTMTKQARDSEQARVDLVALDGATQVSLAEAEDCAFGILARLYGIDISDSGKGSDSVGVSKDG